MEIKKTGMDSPPLDTTKRVQPVQPTERAAQELPPKASDHEIKKEKMRKVQTGYDSKGGPVFENLTQQEAEHRGLHDAWSRAKEVEDGT